VIERNTRLPGEEAGCSKRSDSRVYLRAKANLRVTTPRPTTINPRIIGRTGPEEPSGPFPPPVTGAEVIPSATFPWALR
jgi:hypothetical protein